MPVPVSPQSDGSLIEVFSSIQGEGVLVGCRQIFLRLPNCNLKCRYCDTPFLSTDQCVLEDPPGSGQLTQLKNPVNYESLLSVLQRWCDESPGAHHSISITGGEPLLHPELLQQWLPELRKLLPIYLETNGTLPDQLETLLPHIDWVSMDIKLESQSGQQTDWQTHQRFLQLSNRVNCYVKVVVGEETTETELIRTAELVTGVSKSIPLILQPVTIDAKIGVSTQRLVEMQRVVAKRHAEVRVIPQTHVFLGLM